MVIWVIARGLERLGEIIIIEWEFSNLGTWGLEDFGIFGLVKLRTKKHSDLSS